MKFSPYKFGIRMLDTPTLTKIFRKVSPGNYHLASQCAPGYTPGLWESPGVGGRLGGWLGGAGEAPKGKKTGAGGPSFLLRAATAAPSTPMESPRLAQSNAPIAMPGGRLGEAPGPPPLPATRWPPGNHVLLRTWAEILSGPAPGHASDSGLCAGREKNRRWGAQTGLHLRLPGDRRLALGYALG